LKFSFKLADIARSYEENKTVPFFVDTVFVLLLVYYILLVVNLVNCGTSGFSEAIIYLYDWHLIARIKCGYFICSKLHVNEDSGSYS